jgi:hypothetical protein
VVFVVINQEETDRDSQEGRQMVPWKEREGGSSFDTSTTLKESDTMEGVHEGGDGGLEEDFVQEALLASLNEGKRRRTKIKKNVREGLLLQ